MTDKPTATAKKSLYEILKESEEYLKGKVKWRIAGGLGKNKSEGQAVCVQYVDARALASFLDEKFGSENWWDEYVEHKGNLFCRLSIKHDGEVITKEDVGAESSTSKEKGEASDAFKRACFKWGIGRFLYEAPSRFIKAKKKTLGGGKDITIPVDDNGKQIFDLNKYFKKGIKNTFTPPEELPKKTHKEMQLEMLSDLGDKHPEILQECINFAGSEHGHASLEDCDEKLLEQFIKRLQREKDPADVSDFKPVDKS